MYIKICIIQLEYRYAHWAYNGAKSQTKATHSQNTSNSEVPHQSKTQQEKYTLHPGSSRAFRNVDNTYMYSSPTLHTSRPSQETVDVVHQKLAQPGGGQRDRWAGRK